MKKIFPAEKFHDQLGHSLQLNKLCEVKKKMHQAPCINMEDRQTLRFTKVKKNNKTKQIREKNKGIYTQSRLMREFHTFDVLAEDVLVKYI